MSTAERAPGRRPAAADLLTIGEVLGRLREDFPDVTPSKVRFLEDRGLVTPARTPSGYRKFAPAHVERLRLVLTLQRDHYLPLRVIGEHLTALDEGREPPLPSAQPPVQPPVTGQGTTEQGRSSALPAGPERSPAPAPAPRRPAPPAHEHVVDLTHPAVEPEADLPGAVEVEQVPASPPVTPGTSAAAPDFDTLVEVAGGDVALVDALDAHGLLPRPLESGDGEAARQVVLAAAALGRHGIEPRHLRVLRTAAEREAGLVEQVAAPLRRVRGGDDLDDRAATVTNHLRQTLGELRSALLVANLPRPSR